MNKAKQTPGNFLLIKWYSLQLFFQLQNCAKSYRTQGNENGSPINNISTGETFSKW